MGSQIHLNSLEAHKSLDLIIVAVAIIIAAIQSNYLQTLCKFCLNLSFHRQELYD